MVRKELAAVIELVAIDLVTLHMVDGRTVQVNPTAIQQLVHTLAPHHHKFMVEGVQCLIRMGGTSIAVVETCEQVERILEGVKP